LERQASGKPAWWRSSFTVWFSDKYLTTVGVKIDKKTVAVDGNEVMLMIWDLAGDDDYQRLQTSYLRGTSGYLLVADGIRQITLDQAIEIQARVT